MPNRPPVLELLCSHSHYARRLLDAHVDYRERLLAGLETPFSRSEMNAALLNIGPDMKSRLRKLRQQVWLRIVARDLSQMADLEEVMATMTHLAEASIHAALQAVYEELAERFGHPIGEESGQVQQLIVVGMGKLGGAELNVSSDVDLIFVYPEEGETNGARCISNHEFFNLLGKQIIGALAEPTGDGFVFRVDMRLRPYGESGALTIGFAALESYFVTQGRAWERYAWIKARALTGNRHDELAAMVNPFVFRRYLDYGAIDQLRDLHRQIRAEMARRDNMDNIKLGPGGIREIEFFAQVFQLIRGGREARLRGRSTLATLDGLVELKILSREDRKAIGESYQFLRNLEHRLQYLDDAQTHSLPNNPDDRLRIAQSLDKDSYGDVLAELDRHRAVVSAQFDGIFVSENAPSSEIAQLIWQETLAGQDAKIALEKFGYLDPERMIERLRATRQSVRYRQLPESSRALFESLAPIVIESAGTQANPDLTLTRSLDLLEAVCRRETYLALLLEHRGALNKLLVMASSSPWAIRYLTQHPILLDELLDHRERIVDPDWSVLTQQLRSELSQHRGDVERQWDLLRHFKQAHMFNLIVQDIAGELVVERLSDHLSALADGILNLVIEAAWATFKSKHRDDPRFCVVGYGKLGSKELGYGSDLDVIFLYDDDHPAAAENYARLAQRLNSWLTTYTPAGVLYETDLRLRPDGASGLLVSTIAAFAQYQLRQAWLWEHQALTRARFCAGDARVGAEFERVRGDVLCRPRDSQQLRNDVVAMREKMRQEQSKSIDEFDIKHGNGGLIDIEFMVQYLVLNFAVQHHELAANIGNIALLRRSAALGLIDSDLGVAVENTYRDLRRMQHRAWLDERADAKAERARVEPLVQPVRTLWQRLFAGTA
jgi:[glutamine synthetase] adenylyltransferase / [glutamine synthetase]-adenylyl-L-tyrosine phosphorylase